MKRFQATRLSLEMLETRWCPSVSAHLVHHTLEVVAANSAETLNITETAQGTFAVNNGSPVGKSPFNNVTNVVCHLDNASDTVTIDLGGFKLNGNLEVFFGKGKSADTDQLTVKNGKIGGELHVAGGPETDTVTLGVAGAATSLEVFHDAYINEASGGADKLEINDGVTLDQALTAISTNNFDLAAGSTVKGDLIISGGSLQHTVTIEGNVNHTLYFTGSVHADSLTVAASATLGSLVVHLGNAPKNTSNEVSIGATINNLLNILGGAGADHVTITGAATIKGTLTARLGAGDDIFTVPSGANGLHGLVNGGSGSNTFNGGHSGLKLVNFQHINP